MTKAHYYGVPVISSRIAGSTGLLGDDYGGYFDVGDTRQLAKLLQRAEDDAEFYGRLEGACRKVAWITDPLVEKQRWKDLLDEFP